MTNLSLDTHFLKALFKRKLAKVDSSKNSSKNKYLLLAGTVSTLLLSACSSHNTTSTPISTIKQNSAKPVIALVLGGGGAKGFAHVGVIKVLEENGIQPNLIVGTSVGSLVGSLYASGKSPSELEDIATTLKDSELTDFTVAYQGIIEGKKLRQFVNTQVDNTPIENFPTRFAAVAAEKHTLQKAVFTQGDAGLIVQASSSVPNIFIAPRLPDPNASNTNTSTKKYVDGGVVSIVPVDAAKSLGADVVIAVDLQAENTQASFNSHSRSFWGLIEQGYRNYTNRNDSSNSNSDQRDGKYAANYQNAKYAEINRADVIIRPNVTQISALDTINREDAIQAGVDATRQNLPAIKAAIEKAQGLYTAMP